MNFKLTGVNYWKEYFKDLNHLDILSYSEVVDRYIKTSDSLKGNHEKFGWNERPINSSIDKLTPGANWEGFDPLYFNIDPTNEKVVQAKADVISMDMVGLGESWDSFVYITLPYELINKYMTNMHDNENVSIARKFIREVEATKQQWEGNNWKKIEKQFDEEYPETSQYTDFYETHTCLKWKQDFDIRQYISIKNNGILFPICYNSFNEILRRGTHRAVLLAMTESDIPIFVQIPKGKLAYKVYTPEFFNGKKLNIDINLVDKSLKFYLEEEFIGTL